MHIHEHHEQLCAQAASGQASESELAELKAHLLDCPSCRCLAADFGQLSGQVLAAVVPTRAKGGVPAGMTERFLARARSEGIPIERGFPSTKVGIERKHGIGLIGVVGTAAVVAILLILTIVYYSTSTLRDARVSSGRAAVVSSAHATSPQAPPLDTKLKEQLTATLTQMRAMSVTMKAEQDSLQSASREKEFLTSRLAAVENDNASLRASRSVGDARIALLEAGLEKSKSERSANNLALLLQENELHDLRQRVAEQTAAAQQQRELASVGSQVRDLVVARNLHIVDVYDRDGDGKSQRAFGRIFYTEGNSLIFYAYDLADPGKVDAKISFYVWGEKLQADQPVRNLGIFHSDDPVEGRWVLTFDDPHVLAQINSVFVTVETAKKEIKKPNGKRILFAFLGNKANHP